MDLPFEEKWENERVSIRAFTSNIDDEELKWHFDEEDRMIESIGETDWLFQFDDHLPEKINKPIRIEKGRWHRLIKGTGDLRLRINRF
jgi:hypothetical protein